MIVPWDYKIQAFLNARQHLADTYRDRGFGTAHFDLNAWKTELDIEVTRNGTTGEYQMKFKSPEHFTAFLLEWQ